MTAQVRIVGLLAAIDMEAEAGSDVERRGAA
jgi:hypothetical protein